METHTKAECRRRLLKNGHIWNTAVQAFDVRYQKGCITNRSKLLELPPIKKVEAPVVKHNNKTQRSHVLVFSNILPSDNMRDVSWLQSVFCQSVVNDQTISTESDTKELSAEYDHFHLQKINQFTRQMSSFVSMLLAETGKPEVIRDFLHMFLINGDCTIKWLANKKIVDSRLPNILMKAYAEKACMADCLKFHQLLIRGSVTMNIETYIWMLLAALRSESPQSNTNMVLRKIEDVNLTHLLPIGLSSNLMTPYRDLMKEVMQGVEQYRPDLQLEQLTTSRMATNCDEEYINSVARGFNVPYESPNPHLGVISEQDAVSLVEKQMHLETQGDIPIESISVVKFSEKTFQARKSYKEMMEHWRTSLAQNFQSVLERAEFDKDANIINWIQVYMECMPAETLVNIMLEESARMCEMSLYYSHYYGFICQKLGELVRKCYLGYKNQTLTSKIKDVQMEYINNFYNNATHSTSYRQQFLQADSDNLLDQCVMDRWPPSIIHAVGELLLDIILKSTKVPVELLSNGNTDEPIPAFYIVNRHFKTHVVKQFKPHPSIKKLLDLAQLNTLHLNITELPVFTPPVPSLDDGKGILFQTRTRLVKASREDYFGPGEVREMLPVLDALNILSAVPWRVNTNISPLVIKVFNDGGDAATKIPLASEHASLTEEECGDLEPKQIDSKLKKIKNELISDRASFLLALSIANYCGDDLFWLPSNLDFRGRAYPLSAHFSHVSSDPRRAMLKFAKGKRLGKEGLEWLKIHLVNMTGHKKQASNSERLAYAEELMANAFESADNPLEVCDTIR
ncbi:hypothetical protein EB796_017431 [Bugula neritina]|uniref:DNA-directed RNA polymerase n=1 Tax=Bugula neritina TaxID=10212 RepID=A0A7J7JDI9_BUGNE|nr:hypothetical protein EB796_017431 [Bugula neritina]